MEAWLEKMKVNEDFGEENVDKIESWLVTHEKTFGTEFEERYDPFVIIIKIANLV